MQVILRDPEHDEHMGFCSVLLLPSIWTHWLRRGNPPLFYYNNERIKKLQFLTCQKRFVSYFDFQIPFKALLDKGFRTKISCDISCDIL